MGKGTALAAEAKGYAKVARQKEEAGETEHARKLYLKAAECYLESSRQPEALDIVQMRKDFAETFYSKAMALKPPKKIIAVGEDGVEGEAKEIVPIEKPDINFSDVGGMDAVKEEVKKAIVYPFEKPELYKMYGKKAGEGIIFYGPPGCGKTFIARASAGECKAAFITLRVSDILSKWVGESEKNIRAAFDAANKNAPSILFFDEIDAIGRKRSDTDTTHAKQLVNELLVSLDGVERRTERMLTLAATNEPWAIDPALRRPGRFSKLILIPPPDNKARLEIFKLHMKDRPIDTDVDFIELAKITDGYSSADIAQICNEAADIPLDEALRGKNPRKITMKDFHMTLKKRRSSLLPWFKMAREQIKKSGEEEVFKELMAVIGDYLDKKGGGGDEGGEDLANKRYGRL